MSDSRLLERFVSLCEIASPTGHERELADWLARDLRAAGLEVSEDGAAGPARAGSGNLIARLPGSGEGWVMFCAHIDTVPHPEPIEVALDSEGVFRSRGETILGADNKAAVTVIAELAARWAEASEPPPVGIELAFTVAEEDGLRGAKELDLSTLASRVGFVLDHASPIGELITAAPTYMRLMAEFEGVEAHAGIRPEDGVSAISAAAAGVESMKLGRIAPETTANVGVISGGTATNVVAGHCTLDAEARSLDDETARSEIGKMVDACTWAASERSCDVDCDVWEMFRAYRLSGSDPGLRLAKAGLERCGIEPVERTTGGGSDANALIARGFDAVLLANGTEANHTAQESVAADRLVEMLAVCEAIVAGAAEL
ncbi:MAG: M20/M25/M40 family metallo-hydrolase [Solirubrobacterales bacterium]|nr:M20/M25/M40 family metallo-hydrolase [Solirubrobacterales bacterium]